jgi:hypothetical protein
LLSSPFLSAGKINEGSSFSLFIIFYIYVNLLGMRRGNYNDESLPKAFTRIKNVQDYLFEVIWSWDLKSEVLKEGELG